jgi:hypothetical protein
MMPIYSSLAMIAALRGGMTPQSSESVKITGFAEGYVGWSSPNTATGLTRVGRQFDTRNKQVRLSAVQANIVYTAPDGKFGATISPWFGDNADILFLGERSDSKIAKHLAQAYVTFTGKNVTIDAGKFYSWIGYESPESMQDDLYSRGFLYTLAQPVYHLGARLSTQINPQWGASLYGTSGWNQVQRSGGGITAGAQLRYSPTSQTSATLGFITGREGDDQPNHAGGFGGIGFGSPGTAQTDLADFILTHQATPKLKLALNADYTSAHGGGNSGTWSGVAAFARYQQDAHWGFGARLESVRDDGGLRIGQPATLGSLALGVDYAVDTHVLLRGELRHDWASASLFNSLGGPRRNQTTFTLSAGVKF